MPARFDELIHQRARLSIMSLLAAAGRRAFEDHIAAVREILEGAAAGKE